MEKYRKDIIYLLIIGVLLLLFCLTQCEGKTATIVKTPEVKGTLHDTIKVTYTKIVPKEKIVVKNVPYEVVKELKTEGETVFISEIDTLKTQGFKKDYEDDKIKLSMSGIVTGEINDIKADYTIKPQLIKTPRNKRFGLGVSIGYGIDGKPYGGIGLNCNIINF